MDQVLRLRRVWSGEMVWNFRLGASTHVVLFFCSGEDPSQAVAHSLSWVKEPQMTGRKGHRFVKGYSNLAGTVLNRQVMEQTGKPRPSTFERQWEEQQRVLKQTRDKILYIKVLFRR